MELGSLKILIGDLDNVITSVAKEASLNRALPADQRSLICDRLRDIYLAVGRPMEVQAVFTDGDVITGTSIQDAAMKAANAARDPDKLDDLFWATQLNPAEEQIFKEKMRRAYAARIQSAARREACVSERTALIDGVNVMKSLQEAHKRAFGGPDIYKIPQEIRAKLAETYDALSRRLQTMEANILVFTAEIADIDRRLGRDPEANAVVKETTKETTDTPAENKAERKTVPDGPDQSQIVAARNFMNKAQAVSEAAKAFTDKTQAIAEEPLSTPPRGNFRVIDLGEQTGAIVTDASSTFTVSTEIEQHRPVSKAGLSGHHYVPYEAKPSER